MTMFGKHKHRKYMATSKFREEWDYLKRQHQHDYNDHATEQQRTFLDLITSAAKRLFNYMDISNEDALTHRIYDAEIIDLTSEVSFIVICPTSEQSCSVPGQREILLQRGDLLSLPVQVRTTVFYHRPRKCLFNSLLTWLLPKGNEVALIYFVLRMFRSYYVYYVTSTALALKM